MSATLTAQAAQFQRDGFLHVPGVLSADEIASFGAAVDEAVTTRKRFDTRKLEDKTPYEQSFIQCQYIWEDFPGVRGLTFHPKIGEIAASLIGAERIRLWHDQALYKEAGGRETEAHQDHPYWPINETDTLTVWIPFLNVDHQSGCMGYVPGSHRDGPHFVDIFRKTGDGQSLLDKYPDNPPVFVPCKAGDVIFHHGYTAHLAKANQSAGTRRVYTAIYIKDGCTRSDVANLPHPSVDRDSIAVGAPINGAATPIVWPLPNGQTPEPKPWPPMSGKRAAYARQFGVIPTT